MRSKETIQDQGLREGGRRSITRARDRKGRSEQVPRVACTCTSSPVVLYLAPLVLALLVCAWCEMSPEGSFNLLNAVCMC